MTLLLTRRDVADLLTIDDCISAVENAFRLLGRGEVPRPAIAGVHGNGGAFHIKAAIAGDRFAAKMNSNFFDAKPRIKGVIIVCDANDGRVLAVMDSIEITILRTGAATAVAAKYLARKDAKTALIFGCGNQGKIQARALRRVRKLDRIFAFDSNRDVAADFAEEIGAEVVPAPVWADIMVTMASSRVVTDVTEQCRTIGDLHHAIDAGAMRAEDVYAELSEIVAGKKRGRERDDDVIIFDSTGMALQDVAAAAIVYERALAAGRGTPFEFGAF